MPVEDVYRGPFTLYLLPSNNKYKMTSEAIHWKELNEKGVIMMFEPAQESVAPIFFRVSSSSTCCYVTSC